MKPLRTILRSVFLLALLAPQLRAASDAELNAQLDLAPTDGRLNAQEMQLGIIHRKDRLNLPALRALEGQARAKAIAAILEAAKYADAASADAADFEQLYVDYRLDRTASSYPLGRIKPKAFGLHSVLVPGPTTAQSATQPQASSWDLALRRTKDQVLEALREPGQDYEPFAEGAHMSYQRDQEENVDSLKFEGVFGLSWHLGPNPRYKATHTPKGQDQPSGQTVGNTRPLRASELYLLTSIDRLDDDRPIPAADRSKAASNPKEKDTLAFEFGLTNRYAWKRRTPEGATDPAEISRLGDNWLGILALGANAGLSYTTDSEFRRAIWAGNLMFEPTWAIPGMHGWRGLVRLSDRYERDSFLLGYRFSLTCGIQGGTAEEEGSDDFDRKEDGFLYAGFTLALDVDVLPTLLDHRLALRASYSQWEGLLSGVAGVQDFRASLRYYLPVLFGPARVREAAGAEGAPAVLERGELTWAIEIAYRHGEDPITLEVAHSLTFGASVAF